MSCAKSELCIFDRPTPQVVIEHASFEEVFPVNSITPENTDLEFHINGSQTEYLDLNDTLLYVTLKVVQHDGSKLPDAHKVTPSNYLFHTLFKDVILGFNSTKIEGGNGTYAQKAIIETILNYSGDAKNICLAAMGYHNNIAGQKAMIVKDKDISLCSSLQLDFMDQPKYLIPGINVHIKLKRADPKYSLEDEEKLKPQISFKSAKLIVRRVRVDPSVLIGHTIGLSKQNAVYPIQNKEVVSFPLQKDLSSFYKEQVFGDRRLPNFLLVSFQSSGQYNGSYTENSWLFKHYDVSSITLFRNTDYRESYNQNFENNDYSCSYVQSIVRNMGYLDKNLNCGITLADFKDKFPLFTFVLSPDFDLKQSQVPQQGNLRLDIKFAKPLPESCYIVIYGVFENEIQVTSNRTILL